MSGSKIDFTGKTAVVIGGTTGIGRATAAAFAASGANVVFAGLGAEDGKSLEAEIRATGAEAVFIEADVRREADIAGVIETAVKRFGRIDTASNNAGVESRYAPLHETTTDEFDHIIGINLKGVYLGMRYQIQQMIKQGGGGTIVNTSSTAGVAGMANIPVYTASKHAIVGLTKAAALEVGKYGIRVNAIAPGATNTGLLHRMLEGHVDVSTIGQHNPLGRVCDPWEIANAILWLASDQSSYVTGHVLVADGGTDGGVGRAFPPPPQEGGGGQTGGFSSASSR